MAGGETGRERWRGTCPNPKRPWASLSWPALLLLTLSSCRHQASMLSLASPTSERRASMSFCVAPLTLNDTVLKVSAFPWSPSHSSRVTSSMIFAAAPSPMMLSAFGAAVTVASLATVKSQASFHHTRPER